jgi:hypothetical protein
LTNQDLYKPGQTNWFTMFRHKIPAGLPSPSEYCITYSSLKTVPIRWANVSASYADYIIGNVPARDFGEMPATAGKVQTWCSGPYPAKAGSVFEIELPAREDGAFIYSVQSQMPESKLAWTGPQLTLSGSAAITG